MENPEKASWIKREWDQYSGDKNDLPLFVTFLNELITSEMVVVSPPNLSVSAIAENMPDADNLIIQNDYNGTYTSILENFAAGKLTDVRQDLKNLLPGSISPEGKQIIRSVIDSLDGYMASPPTNAVPVLKPRSAVEGFDTVYQFEVEQCLAE